jgi:iron(III) transport system substrate-binding protein
MRFRDRRRILAGLLTAAVTIIAAPAFAEESVTLYTSVPTTIISKIEKAFEAHTPGVDLKVFRSGTGKIAAKIATEREAGSVQADVIWVADFAYYETLKEQKLLLKYDSPAGHDLPASMKDPDGYYYSARMIAMALAYNRAIKDPPRRWTDLLDAKWKNKVVMSNPQYSGAALDTVGGLIMNYGLAYFRKLRANGAIVVRANNTVAAKVASGEFPVGIALDYFVRNQQEKGSPIALVYPEDGAVAIASPIAIISTSKHQEAAKKFLDYVISKEGQEALRTLGSFIPVRPGMTPPAGAPTVQQLNDNGLPMDWGYVGRNTKWLQDQFAALMLH